MAVRINLGKRLNKLVLRRYNITYYSMRTKSYAERIRGPDGPSS